MEPQVTVLSADTVTARLVKGFAVLAVMVLFVLSQQLFDYLPWYRELYKHFPYYIPEGIKSICQIILALVVLRLLWARSLRMTLSELGVFSSAWRGAAFGFGSAAVMFIGFAATTQFKPADSPLSMIYLVGLSPLAEETVFRAFGVGSLRDRCRAPLWLSLLLPALIFGWGHVGEGAGWAQNAELFSLTAVGGLFFGWFYLRWKRNLWVAFFIHAAMNLSWELFSVSNNAVGGWFPFALQFGAIIVGVLLTLKFTSRTPAVKASAATA